MRKRGNKDLSAPGLDCKKLKTSSQDNSSKESDPVASSKSKSSSKKSGSTNGKQKFEIGQVVFGHSTKYNQLFDAKVH